MKMSELCEIRGRIGFRGYTRRDIVDAHKGAISLSPSNIINGCISYKHSTYISWSKYEESPEIYAEVGDIVFAKTASVGKTAIIKQLPEKATINPQLVLLKNIKCNASYLSYLLKATEFQTTVRMKMGIGSVPNISQKAIGEILVPIPPLAEQERIVGILDRFETLANDIAQGLPAEIDARRQQYEYYRDKLLSFKAIG